MKLKDQKGFVGSDIIIALISLAIFVVIITVLITEYNSSVKEIELKAVAMEYAINEIENLKGLGYRQEEDNNNNGIIEESLGEFSGYDDLGISDNLSSTSSENDIHYFVKEEPILENYSESGYYLTTSIQDYNSINQEADPNKVKEIKVVVSYMFQGERQDIELSIVVINK